MELGAEDQWDQIAIFQAEQDREEEKLKKSEEKSRKQAIKNELLEQIWLHQRQQEASKKAKMEEDKKILALENSGSKTTKLDEFKKHQKQEMEWKIWDQDIMEF